MEQRGKVAVVWGRPGGWWGLQGSGECGTRDKSLEHSIPRKRDGEGDSRNLCVGLVPSLLVQGAWRQDDVGGCRTLQKPRVIL